MPWTPSLTTALQRISIAATSAALLVLSGCSAVENIWPFGGEDDNTGSSTLFRTPLPQVPLQRRRKRP